jgi:putative hydrolase of the HAD superfamily
VHVITRDIDPHEFLGFERRIDYSVLTRIRTLAAALEALPGRRFVYRTAPSTTPNRRSGASG